MITVSKDNLVRKCVQIRNPTDQSLTVWLEPWGEQFELKSQDSFDIVFVGPDTGQPQIAPKAISISVYGWEGSEGFVFQNGRLAGPQPTIAEILQQELEVAGDGIRWKRPDIPVQFTVQRIAHIQPRLDQLGWGSEAREAMCELVELQISEWEKLLRKSQRATDFIWSVASRIVALRGLLLTSPDRLSLEKAIWDGIGLRGLVCRQVFPVLLPAAESSPRVSRRKPVKPRNA